MKALTQQPWMPRGEIPPGYLLRGFRYRLYPTRAQAAQLRRQLGACRWVWNYFLGWRNQTGQRFTYTGMTKHLTTLKREEGLEWLKEANAPALQQTLLDLEGAFQRYRQGLAGQPRFKKYGAAASFRAPQRFCVDAEAGRLHLPKFAQGLKIRLHRPLGGAPRSVTVTQESDGRWFASVLCLVERTPPEHSGGACGVDVGLKTFAVIADDFGAVTKIETPSFLRKSEQRRQRLQRQLARRQPGSRGQAKARLALARQHAKVRRQRADFLHQHSAWLTDKYALIGMETLNVAGMLGNHHLAKSISDAG